MAELEQSLDEFLAANTTTLEASGMPRRLWASIWGRIEANKLGSINPTSEEKENIFDLALVNEVVCVVAGKPLIPRAAVVVYPHEWTFTDRDQAREHLTNSPQLVSALSSLIMSVNVMQGIGSETVNDHIQHIMDNLHRIAFSYDITGVSADGESDEVKTLHYCVVSDPFGPAVIPESPTGNPMLTGFVFVDQRTFKGYTVFYPGWIKPDSDGPVMPEDDDEDTIPQNCIITRSALKPFSA
ncbi:hypothetical protein HDU79_007582 [Rhizoclosmatium sp. JEL0117]|nr:hypothetical protein HDU79_007582 [Rhizoclosmatium sp. JEL0117]